MLLSLCGFFFMVVYLTGQEYELHKPPCTIRGLTVVLFAAGWYHMYGANAIDDFVFGSCFC